MNAVRGSMATKASALAPANAKQPDETHILKLDGNLAYRLSLLNALVGKATSRVYGEEGLNTNQWKILSVLNSHEPLPAQSIAQLVTLDKAAISRTVQQLLKQGFVQRHLSPAGGATIEISMSVAGRCLYTSIAQRTAALQAVILQDIKEPERRALFKTLVCVEKRVRLVLKDRADSEES